ncbi:MAG TPA: ABC transporter permease subunit [Candidatus Aquicultor sp.]|jgi:ABC-2 type transport system permease protein
MSKSIRTIIAKELKDILRSRSFLILCAVLAIVVILSLVIASMDFHAQLADYQQYLQALRQNGGMATQSAPQFFALQQLRSSIEYLEIIGAIVAIIVGYGVIAKEKYRGTMKLLFSRPLGTFDIALGKIIALAIVWALIIFVLEFTIIATLRFVGGAILTNTELLKLTIGMGMAWVYLLFWTALAMGLAGYTKQLTTALIVSFILWLSVVLIVPQIGDTMDPDNQVPGGLFKALQVNKAHEKAVLARFHGYEVTRNYLEESSLSKHFERADFAILGIKDEFNQKPVFAILLAKWGDMVWLICSLLASILLALAQFNKRTLIKKGIR